MSTWNAVVTNGGKNLLASWVTGTTFNFDGARGGTGTVPIVSLLSQTALTNQKQVLSLLGYEVVTGGVKLKIRITAPATGYTLNQIGIWGSVDGGAAVMMALFQNEDGVSIPSSSQTPDFIYNFFGTIVMSNTGTFTLTIDTSAVISRTEYEAGLAEKQDEIDVNGILKGEGSGGVRTATPGVDYATPNQIPTVPTISTNISTDASSDAKTASPKAVKTYADNLAATKQAKITAVGLLKGLGNGSVAAAVAGTDYGLPLASGSGAPSTSTVGVVGQHYFDTASGKEYVCKAVSGSTYTWALSGASDAADLTYNGGSLDSALDDMAQDLTDLGQAMDGSKTLTGTVDPSNSTEGTVGQMYLNTVSGETFICTAASGGTYTWGATGSKPVYPQIVASVSTGSAVTCTDGTTTLTATAAGGKATFEIPNYGNWTLQATLSGQTSGAEVVAVDSVKQYAVTLSYFSATLTVTAEAGAAVTATDGTHTYSGTCASNGKCSLTVRYAGTYTLNATLNNAPSSTTTASVTTSGSAYAVTLTFCTLTVTIDSGSSVTVTKSGVSLTGTSTGTVKFYLPSTGTWSVTATLSGETATDSIACSSYTGYTLAMSYIKVFGVMWNYANSSTALTRLTSANDPNGLVNVNITTEPSPAIGTGAGSSPFDSYAPWSGMEEYNIVNNAVSYKKGQSGFSRSSYDTVVKIPEYYFKIVDVSGSSKRYFYVADGPKAGFTKHPGSDRYVGKYNTISGYYSKTGSTPLTSITRATARSNSANKGANWWQYDFATWNAIQLLYLVEFADWNSQTHIGRGNVDSGSKQNNGGTDSMTYHTGRASGTDGSTQVMYRWIENLWGNVLDWVDGANFSERATYLCTAPGNFADDTATNYTAAGVTLPSSGWITKYGVSSVFPWSLIPNTAGGSDSTNVPDYVGSGTGWRVLCVGGYCSNASSAGLFYFSANYTSSSASDGIGARLLFVP